MMRRNLVLIGMPGSGKTTIGGLLAEKLGRKSIDLDAFIEKHAGHSINELFCQWGEEYFRKLETEVVLMMEKEEASVISTGGGIVKRAINMESLKKNGIIIFIDRNVNDIMNDLDASTRPLLAGGADRLIQLHAERYDLYKKYSNFTFKNEGKINEVVENICNIVRSLL